MLPPLNGERIGDLAGLHTALAACANRRARLSTYLCPSAVFSSFSKLAMRKCSRSLSRLHACLSAANASCSSWMALACWSTTTCISSASAACSGLRRPIGGDEREMLSIWPTRERVGDVRGARESFGVFSKASGGLLARRCFANSAVSSPTDGVVPGMEAVDSMVMSGMAVTFPCAQKGQGGGDGVSQACMRSVGQDRTRFVASGTDWARTDKRMRPVSFLAIIRGRRVVVASGTPHPPPFSLHPCPKTWRFHMRPAGASAPSIQPKLTPTSRHLDSQP